MTKKLLITGMNRGQCVKDFFHNQQLKVVPSHYALIRVMEDLGFEVEQREVQLGEDLSGYDEVIIYMHSPQSFCQNLYAGCYALSVRPDAILAFDDWQVDQIYSGISGFNYNLTEEGDKAFRGYLLDLQVYKYDLDTYKKYKQNFKDATDLMLSKKNRLLISAFDKGNLDLLNLGWQPDRVFRFNPNPYHYNRTPENDFMGKPTIFGSDVAPEEKKMEWNFASLVQKKTRKWLKEQNAQWPVNIYGARRGEEKSERLTEDEMCRVYSEQWGCLMPEYSISGSGWWRARYLQVADAGSILVCSEKDLMPIYQDKFLASLTPSDIELMDLTQLTNTAKMQKEALYDNHPLHKGVTKRELTAILEASK